MVKWPQPPARSEARRAQRPPKCRYSRRVAPWYSEGQIVCRTFHTHAAGVRSEVELKLQQGDLFLLDANALLSGAFAEVLSKLSSEKRTPGLLLEEIWGRHKVKDTTLASITEVVSVLSRLKVPCHIDQSVLSLLSKPILEAARIVVDILSDRIDNGLPVEHVMVEPLVDIDAGQWKEVVFRVHVKLESRDANREWDYLLAQIAQKGAQLEDPEIAASLQEDIGIHFAWVTNSSV